jgi:hypothetical protein
VVSVDLDGYNEVQNTAIRQARKLHKCDACRTAIKPGERYRYVFTVYDGEADTTKRCLRCEAIYRHLCDINTDSDTGVDGALNCGHSYRDIHECDPPEEIARLAFLTAAEVEAGLTEAERKPVQW